MAFGRVSLKHSSSWLCESELEVAYFRRPLQCHCDTSVPESDRSGKQRADPAQQTTSPPQGSPVLMQMDCAHLPSEQCTLTRPPVGKTGLIFSLAHSPPFTPHCILLLLVSLSSRPLGSENLLLRGATLKNTEKIFGKYFNL